MDKLREVFGQKRFHSFLVIFEEGFEVPIKELEVLSRGPFKNKKPMMMDESMYKKLKDKEYNTMPILYLISGDDIKNGEIVEHGYNQYNKGKFYMIKNNPRNTALYVGPLIQKELLQRITGRKFLYYIGTTPEKATITSLQKDFDVIELKDPIKDQNDLVLWGPIRKAGRNWFYIKNSRDKEDIKGLQDIGQDSAALVASFMDRYELSEIKDKKLLSRVEAVKEDLTEKELKLKEILEKKNEYFYEGRYTYIDVCRILKDLYEKGYKDSEILKVAKKYHVFYFKEIDELIHMINDIYNIVQSPRMADNIKTTLLLHGKDGALRDVSGYGYGYLEVVRFLLENGADVHSYDDGALRDASTIGRLKVVRLLLENGADVHSYDDEALRRASTNGHLEVVRLLLENGADVHANKDEALKGACKNQYLEVVRLLLENGATVYNETIQYAVSKRLYGVIGLLLKNLKEPREGESRKQRILRLQRYRRTLHIPFLNVELYDPERVKRISLLDDDNITDFMYEIIKVFNRGDQYKYQRIENMINRYKDTISLDDIIYMIQNRGIKDNENLITFLEELELSQAERED